ncbi:Wac fibritin neck whiskers [Aeromonas phage 65]|uniref:Wac fibritin neck whiskers n=1 Tax=Aeromonas phage 65 TaxID=2919549 RepID=E5DRT1_9CAUD|nr:fibritin neck whisker [Aeromonas phage 65]ADQ53105.1 Wac fibritin neck whiskers [Aeromonas phage 65]
MEIIKPILDDLKYTTEVPVAGSGQQQIDWVKNGERSVGADPTIVGDKSGVINRTSVQVSTNVDILDKNQDTMLETVNEIITKVNIHDEIINSGDGLDLYERVDALEDITTTHSNEITILKDVDTVTEVKIKSISDNIGVGDPSMRYRTLREDDLHIKRMIGNYTDFNIDGDPAPGVTANGVKGQVERNYNSLVNQGSRITALEKWWDDSTPASLMEEVNQIRSELGDSNGNPETIYNRIDSLESSEETNTPIVENLVTHTGLDEFPLQYLDVETETYIDIDTLIDYSKNNKKDIDYIADITKQSANKIDDIDRSLGSPADSTLNPSAWGKINDLGLRVATNEIILGASPLDGLQGKVGAIDIREAGHFTDLDNRVGNLTETVNVEYRTAISDLQKTVSDPNTGLYVKMEGSKKPSDVDFVKKGVYLSSKEMYDGMFQEYQSGNGYATNPTDQVTRSAWAREYDGTKWDWRNIFKTDFLLGEDNKIKAADDTNVLSYTLGSDGKYIPTIGHNGTTKVRVLGELIGNVYLEQTSDIIKFGQILFGSTDRTVSVGQLDKSFVISGKNNSSLKYLTSNGEYEVLHVGNYNSYISDINPENGFTLDQDSKIGYAGADFIKLVGSDFVLGSAQTTMTIDSNINKLVLDPMGSIKFNVGIDTERTVVSQSSNKIIFGDADAQNVLSTDFYVQGPASTLYKVWHQGMDAPSDGSFYARKNNQWEVITSGSGGSGNIPEVPQSGKAYARVNDDGVGAWQEVGGRDIQLGTNVAIRATTNGGVVNAISVDSASVTTHIGAASGFVKLEGVVNDFVLNRKISTALGSVIDRGASSLVIGDATNVVPVYSTGALYVGLVGSASKVWTDADDAPNDTNFYARKGKQWTLIHDGVDPNKDVVINSTKAYKIGTYDVAKVETVGVDKLMKIGDNTTFLEFAGKVTQMKITEVGANNSFGISTTISGQSVNMLSISQPTIEKFIQLGDSTVPIRVNATQMTINGDEILTKNEFEAPDDGNKYVRQDGEWTRAYYYRDFATDAPATPKEGDLFFEFIN